MAWALQRRRLALIGLFVVLAVANVGSAQAQQSENVEALRAQVSKLYEQGKYGEAAPISERYVSVARERHGEQSVVFGTAIGW